MTQKKILSLDLGTVTGWALTSDHVGLTYGSKSFKPGRFDGGGMRYLNFSRWLTDVNMAQGIEEVYFEEVRRHAGTDAAHAYGGFLATLTSWCEERAIPYQGVPVGTIKKHATGHGNADKMAMIWAAQTLGYKPVDDNSADAIHLLLYALAKVVK